MRDLKYFANDGFGWYCIQCSQSSAKKAGESRLLMEGEAESKDPEMSESARARWRDQSLSILECPHCGMTEPAGV